MKLNFTFNMTINKPHTLNLWNWISLSTWLSINHKTCVYSIVKISRDMWMICIHLLYVIRHIYFLYVHRFCMFIWKCIYVYIHELFLCLLIEISYIILNWMPIISIWLYRNSSICLLTIYASTKWRLHDEKKSVN